MLIGLHVALSTNVIRIHFDERWDHATYNRQFGELLLHLAKHYMPDSWACMENLEHWQVRLPEQVEHCSDIALEMARSGLSHCAVNANDMAISKWVMQSMLPETTENCFFNTDEDCRQWLASLGYDTEFAPLDLNKVTFGYKEALTQ